ncbi:MAG TPA: hypothetical protein VFE34_22340 [Dongiaceae bacterium]|jgi:hypothetical protein|nr:hypothetical protein [Dongiaceae bacterium]
MMLQQELLPASRRDQMRRTVIKGARIVFSDRKSTLDCRIRDLTNDGARLDFSTPQLLPHKFDLHMAGRPVRHCALCWARGSVAGIRFLQAGG